MPRKRTQLIDATEQLTEVARVIEPEPELPDEIALDTLLNKLETDQIESEVQIWQVMPRVGTQRGVSGKDKFLIRMSPAEFLEYGLDGIQSEYGEGEYRVKVYGPGGLQTGGNRVFNIGALPASRRPAPVAVVTNPSGGTSQIDVLLAGLKSISETQQKGFEAIASLLVRNQSSEKENIEKLVLYKQLFTPAPSNGGGTMGNPFDFLKNAAEAVEALKGLGGNGAREPTIVEQFAVLGEKFAPLFLEVLKSRGIPAAQLPPVGAPPAEAAASAARALPNNTTASEDPMQFLSLAVRQYLPSLISEAEKGTDTASVANYILDQIPEAVSDQQIQAFFSRADFLQFLASVDGRVGTFGPWFEQLRAQILKQLTEPAQATINPLDDSDEISTLG